MRRHPGWLWEEKADLSGAAHLGQTQATFLLSVWVSWNPAPSHACFSVALVSAEVKCVLEANAQYLQCQGELSELRE